MALNFKKGEKGKGKKEGYKKQEKGDRKKRKIDKVNWSFGATQSDKRMNSTTTTSTVTLPVQGASLVSIAPGTARSNR